MLSTNLINKTKPTILILLLLPSFIWIGLFITGNLGVNPIDILMDNLGEMSLRILVLVLIVSLLSKFNILRPLQNLRRLIGLVAFYYVALHLSCYVFLDHFFNFSFILKDIIKRPFITFGFLAFILLIPMAITSTNNMVKMLSFRVWKKIHYLIYLIILLGILHFYLLTKGDKTEPLIYLGIVFILFYLEFLKKFSPQVVRR